MVRQKDPNWEVQVKMQSNITGEGLEDVLSTILEYQKTMELSGSIDRSLSQSNHWMWSHMKHKIIDNLENSESVSKESRKLHDLITVGKLNSRIAAKALLEVFYNDIACGQELTFVIIVIVVTPCKLMNHEYCS